MDAKRHQLAVSILNLYDCCDVWYQFQHSKLHVERRKWGNADEREVRRTRSKVIASCCAREWEPEAEGRGFLPREITLSRDHLWPSAANFTRVCMTAFASRCVYYFTRWGYGNWRLEWLQLWLAFGWRAGWGREYRWREARGSKAQPRRGVRGTMPPDWHETHLKCFMNKFCHEMRHDLRRYGDKWQLKKKQLHYAMVHRSVLQWTRGEGTVVAVCFSND